MQNQSYHTCTCDQLSDHKLEGIVAQHVGSDGYQHMAILQDDKRGRAGAKVWIQRLEHFRESCRPESCRYPTHSAKDAE